MKSPIYVLWGNIVHTFENIAPTAMKAHLKAVKLKKVSKAISYDDRKEKIRTPKASLKTRQIYVQETYLSHLWSLMYSIIVMYEEGIQKPLINNTFTGSLVFDKPIMARAKTLFEWSISLKSKYSDWDKNLPNPEKYIYEEEKVYGEKVNQLFQVGTSFLLFHEYAHLTQRHEDFFIGVKDDKLQPELLTNERIQLENECDLFAFNMVVDQYRNDNNKIINSVAIILVMCSSLLIVENSANIKQRKHPDIDNRILSVLNNLDIPGKYHDYCWHLCTLSVQFFLMEHNIEFEVKTYETTREAFFAYLDILDNVKSSIVL